MFFENLRKRNIDLLKKMIESKGGTCEPTVESIFNNLKYLAEKGMSYGEEVVYLPLSIRRIIGTLPEDGHLIFRVDPDSIKWGRENASVTVGGYLVQAKGDGTEMRVSSYSVGSVMRDDIFPRDMMSTEKRESLMLSFAVGKAESNAYYNAGIGAEYKNPDTFDLETFEENVPAAEPELPDPSTQPPAQKGKKKAVKEAAASEQAETPVKTVEPVHEPIQPEEPKAETEVAAETLTLEEARAMIADQGNLAGLTLGEIADNTATSRNLVWLFLQERADKKLTEGLDRVIKSIPGLDDYRKKVSQGRR